MKRVARKLYSAATVVKRVKDTEVAAKSKENMPRVHIEVAPDGTEELPPYF